MHGIGAASNKLGLHDYGLTIPLTCRGGEPLQRKLVEALFAGYFERSEDIGDHDFLASSATWKTVTDHNSFTSPPAAPPYITANATPATL